MRPNPLHTPMVAFLVAAGILLAPSAIGALDTPTLRATEPPFFNADVAVTVDTLARPSVSVTITVPYAELNWSTVSAGYAAGAGFSVELEPAHADRLYGDTWEKRLTLQSYAATRSSRNNLIVQRTFDIPPGRYKIRVHVRDIGSERESGAEDQLVLEDLARVPVGLTDLLLGVIDSTLTWHPVPARAFGFNSDHLAARIMAFDRRPGDWPRQVKLHYRILDDGGNLAVQGDTTLTQAQPAQPLVVRPTRDPLFIGEYTFEMERVEGKARWRTTRTFEVEDSGPPTGKEFTQILDALAYIAPAEEVDALRKLPVSEQAGAWDRFWSRRDPTPDTPRNEFFVEFYRRLHYAARHFQGFGPGWRSDMGRIYIRYGPPDSIEQHPSSGSIAASELWFYNQPYRRFLFFDREGFGRYSLAQPSSE